MVSNRALIFKKTPDYVPEIGEHIDQEVREFDIDAGAPEGGITVKNLYLSFDPYTRGCMRDPDDASWAPPFAPGQPIICGAVAQVLKSSLPNLQPGDLVWGMFGAEEYSTVPSFLMPYVRKLDNQLKLDPVLFTGALGTAGLSAYGSFYGIGKPQRGQTIFISAASGGVGQIVGQLAKMEGLTVIGSVGSDEKLNFIRNELGFDAGFNYKRESPLDALRRLAPEGIDIYFDNVGGETLDAALATMKDFGTIGTYEIVVNHHPSGIWGANLAKSLMRNDQPVQFACGRKIRRSEPDEHLPQTPQDTGLRRLGSAILRPACCRVLQQNECVVEGGKDQDQGKRDGGHAERCDLLSGYVHWGKFRQDRFESSGCQKCIDND
jgi:NADPH-dependent curcumin reductase CurA